MKPAPRKAQKPEPEDDLSEAWSMLRAKPLRRKISTVVPVPYVPPPVEPIIRWTLTFNNEEGPRNPLLVVPGPTAQDRLQVYRKYLAPEWKSFRPGTIEDIVGDGARDWVGSSIVENLTRRIAAVRVPPESVAELPMWFPVDREWGLLWALAGSEDFIVGEGLREMVDQSYYLVHHFYKALWELRFTLKENPSFEPGAKLFFTITRWMTGGELSDEDFTALEKIGVRRRVTLDAERIDILLFLVTLAAQNGIINRMTLCFDGLEQALQSNRRALLRELDTFLATMDRWVGFSHAPIGVMVGFNASGHEMSQLRRLNSKLADRIEAGLVWTKPA